MLNFQAVLTNVKFDIDCRNVLYFENREAQENYFSVASLFSSAQSINFNAGSLIETTIIYQVQENESINDILSKNYCIIKDNNENATLRYYYYFIKNIMQDSGNQVKVWLELDIFQTYFIDIEFSDCEILKAHLNRFIDNGDGTVSFDGGINSQLFEREDIKNVAKRLTKRTKLKTSNTGNSTLDEFVNKYVVGWVYCFLDPTAPFKCEDMGSGQYGENTIKFNQGTRLSPFSENESLNINQLGIINSTFPVIAFPVFNRIDNANPSIVFRYNEFSIAFTNDTFVDFINNNNFYEYIYSIKFSSINPFYAAPANAVTIENPSSQITRCIITGTSSSLPPFVTKGTGRTDFLSISESGNNLYAFKGSNSGNFLYLYRTPSEYKLENYITDKQIKFQKNEIIGSIKNPKFNPKLLSQDFFELRLSDQTENGFSYDMQKLNKNNFEILITEPLVADNTKKYIRISNLDGVYIKENSKNLTGFVSSNETTLPMATSAYANMIANSKNYFIQNAINRGNEFAQNSLSAFGRSIGGTMINSPIGKISGIVGGIQSGLKLITSKVNENLTIDNLQNAPGNISQAKGNVFFESQYSEIGTFVEEYEILPNEKTIINDYMSQYGFTVNKIGNLKNYVNLRKYYNYIEAEIQETSGINISRTVHERFKEMFARGVRFWNVDSFSYDLENYEKWLEA